MNARTKTPIDIEQERAVAEFHRELRAAERAERAAERAEKRAEAEDLRTARQTERRTKRAGWVEAAKKLGRKLRPALPISIVTALAMYGQVGYVFEQITPAWWPLALRLALAGAVAIAVESIALTWQWHAHDSLIHGHTLTAARQRRVAYLIALGVGAINYSHFAGATWSPTPAAVVFALFSASGPWLWGLHTRRAQRVQLSREGQLDVGGAVFRAERYRWFPIRTFMALRWSIDRGITDPRQAWIGYNEERQKRRSARQSRRQDNQDAASQETREERIVRLIEVEGLGRHRLALALGVTPAKARDLIDTHRQRQDQVSGDEDQVSGE